MLKMRSLLVAFAIFSVALATTNYATVIQKGRTLDDLVVVDKLIEQPNSVCFGLYDDTLTNDGFAKLRISCDHKFPSDIQFYSTGLIEGFLMQYDIARGFNNTGKDIPLKGPKFDKLLTVLEEHDSFVKQTEIHPHLKTTILNLHLLIDGLTQGFAAKCALSPSKEGCWLTKDHLLLLNAWGDLSDLWPSLFPETQLSWHKMVNEASDPITRCSALLYKTKDWVAISHNTWDMFSSMLRTMKRYELSIDGKRTAVEFSSQPGTVWSYDDWYVNPQTEMTITETTNNLYNTSLYKIMTPRSLFTWERAMAGSMISESSREFVEHFVTLQSGTYNCQFMAFDEKKIRNYNGELPAETFVIVELMPGVTRAQDMSSVVNRQGFWSSFNIPFFKDVYQASGYGDKAKEHGDSFVWAKAPRKLIFDREVKNIQSFDDMKRVMRYNKYKTDPLMKGDPGFGISARYDLRSDSPKCFGAIDCKIRKLGVPGHYGSHRLPTENLPFGGFEFIAGPTYEGDAEVLVYSESLPCRGVSFESVLDRFDFEWSRWLF
ncbi:hypothetical protein P9112_003501 [Eukaryota sp. TZLM1-RC]